MKCCVKKNKKDKTNRDPKLNDFGNNYLRTILRIFHTGMTPEDMDEEEFSKQKEEVLNEMRSLVEKREEIERQTTV